MLDMFLFVVINENAVYITLDRVRSIINNIGYVSSPVALVTWEYSEMFPDVLPWQNKTTSTIQNKLYKFISLKFNS